MQKITVKNFHAVESADIEVKKVLLLIGENAVGKSTIAKLIYFFKSLSNDLFSHIYASQKEDFDYLEDFVYKVKDKFYNFFGSTLHLKNFEIYYYYNEEKNKYLRLYLNDSKRLQIDAETLLSSVYINSIRQIKRGIYEKSNLEVYEQLVNEQNRLRDAKKLLELINDIFENNQTDSLYVIGARNATVGYPDLFKINAEKFLVDQSQLGRRRKEQTIEEFLMVSFLERTEKVKNTFKRFQSFQELVETYSNDDEKADLYKVIAKVEELLKGKYFIDKWGEKIIINKSKNDYIFLPDASSGQQEVIRIVQDIFLSILDKVKFLKIIEEPEVHLFPIAQKHIIELIALAVNYLPENQVVITTHSPYVLTVLNNLLFANRVVRNNPDSKEIVSEIIPENVWLNSEQFAAYSLNKTKEKNRYCISIVDTKTGLIEQNYLDIVSEMLGSNFNELYKIHSKSFARR